MFFVFVSNAKIIRAKYPDYGKTLKEEGKIPTVSFFA